MLEMDKKFDFLVANVLRVMSRLFRGRFSQNTCVFFNEQAARPMSGLDKKFLYLMSDELRVMSRLIRKRFALNTYVSVIEQAARLM
jgi:hypothetical protein